MDIIAMIKSLGDAVDGVFGWARQRDSEENAAAVSLGEERVQDQRAADEAAKTIAQRDTVQARKNLAELALLWGLFIGGLMFCGCYGTVTPPVAAATLPSWDGTNQNSGFVGWTTNAAGQTTGAFITAHAVDRYRSLMADYGKAWGEMKPDEGITWLPNGGQTFWIDAQHLDYFMAACRWKRNGRAADGK